MPASYLGPNCPIKSFIGLTTAPSGMSQENNDTQNSIQKYPAKTKAVKAKRSNTYTKWFFDIVHLVFIYISLLHRSFNTYAHLSSAVSDCTDCKIPTHLPSFKHYSEASTILLWQHGHRVCPPEDQCEDLCCLFLFWCNIKRVPSVTGVVDGAAPREQPTNQPTTQINVRAGSNKPKTDE